MLLREATCNFEIDNNNKSMTFHNCQFYPSSNGRTSQLIAVLIKFQFGAQFGLISRTFIYYKLKLPNFVKQWRNVMTHRHYLITPGNIKAKYN